MCRMHRLSSATPPPCTLARSSTSRAASCVGSGFSIRSCSRVRHASKPRSRLSISSSRACHGRGAHEWAHGTTDQGEGARPQCQHTTTACPVPQHAPYAAPFYRHLHARRKPALGRLLPRAVATARTWSPTPASRRAVPDTAGWPWLVHLLNIQTDKYIGDDWSPPIVLILATEHGQSPMRWPPVIPWDLGKAGYRKWLLLLLLRGFFVLCTRCAVHLQSRAATHIPKFIFIVVHSVACNLC